MRPTGARHGGGPLKFFLEVFFFVGCSLPAPPPRREGRGGAPAPGPNHPISISTCLKKREPYSRLCARGACKSQAGAAPVPAPPPRPSRMPRRRRARRRPSLLSPRTHRRPPWPCQSGRRRPSGKPWLNEVGGLLCVVENESVVWRGRGAGRKGRSARGEGARGLREGESERASPGPSS